MTQPPRRIRFTEDVAGYARGDIKTLPGYLAKRFVDSRLAVDEPLPTPVVVERPKSTRGRRSPRKSDTPQET